MGEVMQDPPSETVRPVERLRAGDRRALAELFQRHRDRMRRMVELHMDARLYGRLDAFVVAQDGFLDLAKRVESE
jgi:RNA polymerase sigma-70 factor, ECF subfamily